MQKNIARGESLLIFSTILAIIVRIGYYLYSEDQPVYTYPNSGYLWDLAAPFLHDKLYSILGASLGVALMAIGLTSINVKHIIIRERTLLPAAFIILLFSCHPVFLTLNPYLIATLFLLWAISTLLGGYLSDREPFVCTHITFILALGSLFVSYILIFYFLFLIGFSVMRIFNTKSVISSIFSLIFTYFPIFTFFLMIGRVDLFLAPFTTVSFESLSQLPLFSFDIRAWAIIGFIAFLLIAFSANNYLNRHKDRIKTRAYILFFTIVAAVNILLFTFLNIAPLMSVYFCLVALALLQAHFFALIRNVNALILFIFCFVLSLAICYLYILNPILIQMRILY